VETLTQSASGDYSASQNPLLSKQAIIVLREELEYFAIPPKDGSTSTDSGGLANEALIQLKKDCGHKLLEKRSIFTALQRNVSKENNLAEQHLIDMLCMRSVICCLVSITFLNIPIIVGSIEMTPGDIVH